MSLAASASPSALIMLAVFSLNQNSLLLILEHNVFLSLCELLRHLLMLDSLRVLLHEAQMNDRDVVQSDIEVLSSHDQLFLDLLADLLALLQ